jgi:hypothetical protein
VKPAAVKVIRIEMFYSINELSNWMLELKYRISFDLIERIRYNDAIIFYRKRLIFLQ